jgi:hypothetical protein
MSFYVGCYLILSDTIAPEHDSDSWALPDIYGHQGHMSDTSNPEELLIDPEDMDLLPTQIQFGCGEYTDDEGFNPDHEAYNQFYVKQEFFYVRGFEGRDYFSEFYMGDDSFSEFYMPLEYFYVREFTGTDYFREFYMSADTFTEFYAPSESFYVRNFSPTDYWVEFYVKC